MYKVLFVIAVFALVFLAVNAEKPKEDKLIVLEKAAENAADKKPNLDGKRDEKQNLLRMALQNAATRAERKQLLKMLKNAPSKKEYQQKLKHQIGKEKRLEKKRIKIMMLQKRLKELKQRREELKGLEELEELKRFLKKRKRMLKRKNHRHHKRGHKREDKHHEKRENKAKKEEP